MPDAIYPKPTVQFTEEILFFADSYFQPGMRAQIASIESLDDDSDFIRVKFDVKKFDLWNAQFEPSFSEQTWEAVDFTSIHPKFNSDEPWIESLELSMRDSDKFFRLVDDRAVDLYDKFCRQKSADSYVEWLEAQLLSASDSAV